MTSRSKRLSDLRELMADSGLDYVWVPSSDPHFSEYLPSCWQRRQWLSGFTGSAGHALVGKEGAWLWTDSRYFLQAQEQLSSQWTLMRQGEALPILPWLGQHAVGQVVGLDPWLMSMDQYQYWQQQAQQAGISLQWMAANVVDKLWSDQPGLPKAPIYPWSDCYAGLSVSQKLDDLRVKMANHGVDACVVTALDAVAWLTNARGGDVECNPVFIGYIIIWQEVATLYVHANKIEDAHRQTLVQQGVTTAEYDQFMEDLQLIDGVVWVDPQTTSVAVSERLSQAELILAPCPVACAKSIKNQTELAGMQEAHRRDGLAMVRFLCWLDTHWSGCNEVTAAEQLLRFRQQDPHFKQMSFPTICGYADHGAIVHYSATPSSAHAIGDQALLLIDSGGQYDQCLAQVASVPFASPQESVAEAES